MSYVVRSRDVWIPDSDYEEGGYWDVEYYEDFVPDPDVSVDMNTGSDAANTGYTDTTGINTGRVAVNTPISGTPTQIATAKDMLSKVMSGTVTSQDFLKFIQDNPTGMAGIIGGLMNMGNQQQYNRVGYQGTIPQMTATRSAVPFQYDPNRRPGSAGRQYFTDVQYTAPTAEAANAAQGIARTQARSIADQQMERENAMKNATNPALVAPMAEGGLAALAKGRYLQGSTDGMADKLPANIDGKQPAALSHGEFVVPADVVSHLGNGNSDAGAKKLYSMMDKIRMARTGTKKQGKKINPDKYMPGGSVGYASGGEVKGFFAGSVVPAASSSTTTPTVNPNIYESNLSSWAGPYVTGMLGKGQALSEMPYQAYQGPLTSGASGLQQQAFQSASNLQTPAALGQATQTAGDITGRMQGLAGATFGTQQAQQYMNPYMQTALIPQLAEARRQADITNMANMAKLTQAGGYGGGRQAVLQAESDRNMAQNMANITGKGFETAYQQAMAQYNADQTRSLAALQGALGGAQAQGSLGAQQNQVGLANLAQQAALGQQERGITSEGIAADKAQFEEARDYPYKMVQYQQSLLSGLPLQTQAPVTPIASNASTFAQGSTALMDLLAKLGIK